MNEKNDSEANHRQHKFAQRYRDTLKAFLGDTIYSVFVIALWVFVFFALLYFFAFALILLVPMTSPFHILLPLLWLFYIYQGVLREHWARFKDKKDDNPGTGRYCIHAILFWILLVVPIVLIITLCADCIIKVGFGEESFVFYWCTRLYACIYSNRFLPELPRPTSDFIILMAFFVIIFIAMGVIAKNKLVRYYVVHLVLAIALLLFLLTLDKGVTRAKRNSCTSHLSAASMFLAVMPIGKSVGVYPPMSSTGAFVISNKAEGMKPLFGTYINNFELFFCPNDVNVCNPYRWLDYPSEFDPQPYIDKYAYNYLGYIITNDVEMRAFADAYKQCMDDGLHFDTDLEVPLGTGTNGSNRIIRLGSPKQIPHDKSIWQTIDTSQVAVMWDRIRWKWGQKDPVLTHKNGVNVLYLDGHVDFVTLKSNKWPLTEETLRIFRELEER